MVWAVQEYPQLCPHRLLDNLDHLEEQIGADNLVPLVLRVCPEIEDRILDLAPHSIQTTHSYKADDRERKDRLFADLCRMKHNLQRMVEGPVKLIVGYHVRESDNEGHRYGEMSVMSDPGAEQFADLSSSASSSQRCPSTIEIRKAGQDYDEMGSSISQSFDEIALDDSGSRCTSQHNSPRNQNAYVATMATSRDNSMNSNIDLREESKEHEVSLAIPFSTGASLKRKPVEIEQTPLGLALLGEEGRNDASAAGYGDELFTDLAASLLDEPENNNNSGMWLRLQGRLHRRVISTPRCFKSLRFFMITLFALLGLCLVTTSPLKRTNSQEKHSTEDRASHVLDCARRLSKGIGLSGNARNRTSQWHAVNWFLEGGGIEIEVPDQCVWSSSFGIVYGLIVLRESLGVLDKSWRSNVRGENALEDICRWKRITCNMDKTTIQRLTLNHAELSGTIPLELVGFNDLDSLQMENNNNLIGTLPSEIARLTKLQHLLLQQTQLSGTIPKSLGQLTVLKQLLMDHTNLSGTMASEICELRKQNLQFLSSNCIEKWDGSRFVRCDRATCCTYCG
jgi:hypothetical protein